MKDYFKNKKITVMGLGLLGRGVGDAKFLAQQGAELIVTDLKSEEELEESLEQLKGFDNITYTLGGHDKKDFKDRDLIIKAASVPLDSPFISEARANKIPVEMSTALLVKMLRNKGTDVVTIGVTGTRGKSTVVQLVYDILKAAKRSVHLAGNIRGMATLPLLESIKDGDVLVLELDSWQLQGFAEHEMSPNISVFTNFLGDHMDYYDNVNDYFIDKSAIFSFQSEEDTLITSGLTLELIQEFSRKLGIDVPKHPVVADISDIPGDWDIKIPGTHNLENITLAMSVVRALGVPDEATKNGVERFKGVHERLEFMKEISGVKYYNDNKSTTPDSTLAALKALGKKKNIVLILGGTDKGLSTVELIKVFPKYCKAIVLLNEEGTNRIKEDVYTLEGVEVVEGNSPKEIVEKAHGLAESGDIVLFSPAFPSFGKHYVNVYDRGEQFVKNVESL